MDFSSYMYTRPSYEENQYIEPCANWFYEDKFAETNRLLENYNKQSFPSHAKQGINHDVYNFMMPQANLQTRESNEKVLQQLFHVSELADEALNEQDQDTTRDPTVNIPNSIEDLLLWKRCQDRKHEMFMLQQKVMQVKDAEMFIKNRLKKKPIKKFCDSWKSPEKKANDIKIKDSGKNREKRDTKQREGRKPDCWHYIRGHCKRGKYCDFVHDIKHSYPDTHKVFLGGLPFHLSETALRKQLQEKGFNVVNKPKVYGGFSPQVCLASEEQAKRLIQLGSIMINGVNVDVRSYQGFTKKNEENLLDMTRRSVFLGGLCKGTTTQIIKKELELLGVKIVNYPLIKAGFSPQVTMETIEQAQKLVNMVKVEINGTLVDVRPYAGVVGLA